jgi:SAM-dependent methyltransferase
MPLTEYSKYQKDYWWATVRREIISELIEMHISCWKKGSVLDIGCGSGGNLRYIERFGCPIGIDADMEEVVKAKEEEGARVAVADAEKIPFKRDVFSIVSLQDVLEHLYNPEECLNEVRRVCRPGGLIVITVPAYQFLFNPVADEDHRKRYIAREVADMVHAAGFEIIKLSYFNTFLFPLMLSQRLLQKAMLAMKKGENFFPKYPTRFGRLFRSIFELEMRPLRFMDFPFGGSVLCICKKPGGGVK